VAWVTAHLVRAGKEITQNPRQVLKAGLGKEFRSSYLKLKRDDWNSYSRSLTDWARQTTLDC
jgi:glutamine synthetase